MSYTETLPDGTILGDVPGISPGTLFHDRQELHDGKLHRGLINGIAPQGSSIILSGGYQDDEDRGDVIIYTGEGGRDPNTRRQIADQTFTNGNLALAAIRAKLACLLSRHFPRILVFPNSKKDRLAEAVIPCPLCEFYLADHCRLDPVTPFHFGGSHPLIPTTLARPPGDYRRVKYRSGFFAVQKRDFVKVYR